MKIYLIRHTSPNIEAGICYGQANVGVTGTFQEEVKSLLERFRPTEPVSVWSSPLIRCSQLAKELANALPITDEIHYDDRLKETHFGQWELKHWDQIGKETLQHFRLDLAHNVPPGGESFSEVQVRAIHFLKELMGSNTSNQGHVIVTHAGIIRVMVGWVLGFPLQQLFRLHVDYAGITCLEMHQQNPTLLYLNR